jgi:hypothetical protein
LTDAVINQFKEASQVPPLRKKSCAESNAKFSAWQQFNARKLLLRTARPPKMYEFA